MPWSNPLPGDTPASSSSKSDGGFLGIHMPKLGLSELVHGIAGSLSAIERMGVGLLPGGEPAGQAPAAFGKGLLSSFVGTGLNAVDVLTGDQATGFTGGLRNDWANMLGGDQYRPQSLAQEYNQGGILPTVVKEVGNVAAGAGAAGKIASLGELGTVASATAAAGRAADLGYTADEISTATEAAKAGSSGFRDAGISDPALKAAGETAAKAEGLGSGLDPAAVESRARMLNILHDVAHPYKSLFSEVLTPLGRASTESLTAEAQGTAEAPVVPAEAPTATAPSAASTATEPVSAPTAAPEAASKPNTLESALADAVRAHIAKPVEEVGVPGSQPAHQALVDSLHEAAANAAPDINHPAVQDALNRLGLIDHQGEVAPELDHAGAVAEALAPKATEVVPPEVPNTLGITHTTSGPIQQAIERAAGAPIKPWATTVVKHLPTPVVKALSKTDRFISARKTGMVLKEQLRMQDVNRREILNSDAFRVPRSAARDHLVGQVLPDGTKITPKLSDELMGDELIARLEQTSAVEDAVARHASPEAMAHMSEIMKASGARGDHSIPEEWLRGADGTKTELGSLIDESVDHLRDAATERTAILRSNSDKGLEHVGESMPSLSPRSKRLMSSVADDLKSIHKLEESTIPADRIRAAGEMARLREQLQQVGVELHGAHAEAKAASEAFDLTRIPKNASDEYLKSNAPGITKALGIAHTSTPEEMRTALSPAQRMMSTPDVGGMTNHDLYRRGVIGGQQAEKIKAAAQKAVDLEQRKVALSKNLEEMRKSLDEHTLPNEQLRDKLATRADRRQGMVDRQMSNPALAQVPAHLKPVWDSIVKLHQEAENDPELASALSEVPRQWDTVLRIAREQGFDPTHVRSFQPSEIRKLVFDSVSLGHSGRDLGKTVEAGTRKIRQGAQTRTRSLSALAAGITEATHESHTNALADFIEKTWAKPVEYDKEGVGTIPAHGTAWDPARQFLLSGKTNDLGDTVVKGMGAPKMWIPREVNAVLKSYQRDFSHGTFDFIRKATNPWRLAVLTLSPHWYVNHIIGHVMMATKEGVSLGDWANAWRAFREGGADLDRNPFMQKFGAGSSSFGNEAGAVAGGLRNEVGKVDTLVPYARGIKGIAQAKGEGLATAGNVISQRIARPATVVDEIGRVALYFNGVKKGMTDAEALNRTYHAFIDFTDLSPAERQVVRSVVPFYAFQKGMLKIVAKMPIDHPAVTAAMLTLSKVNQDLTDKEFGGPVPSFYSDMLDIPGLGRTPVKPLNPFADSDTLTTPQGIANSLNPLVSIAARNALGAPGTQEPQYRREDAFGKMLPDTSPAQDLGELLGNLPQAKAAGSGGPSGFVLPKSYDPAAIQALAAKLGKAPAGKKAAAVKSPYEQLIADRLKASKSA